MRHCEKPSTTKGKLQRTQNQIIFDTGSCNRRQRLHTEPWEAYMGNKKEELLHKQSSASQEDVA